MSEVVSTTAKRRNKGQWQPGQSGNPKGRPKGAKNKVTRDLVGEILTVYERLKERGLGLYETAVENPKWFYEVFMVKLIPRNVSLETTLSIEDIFIKLDNGSD